MQIHEHQLSLGSRVTKRCFDMIFSMTFLVLLSWLVLLTWIVATIDTSCNGFYVQKRVGRYGRLFNLIKIRTMQCDSNFTTTVTCANDPRITTIGRFLRKTKLDELPQLMNILIGDMSVVGPRPDVPGFADVLLGGDRVILSVRPGLTGPASLKYRNEEELLAAQANAELYNREVIYPDKVKINVEYVKEWSFTKDIKYLWMTFFSRV